MNAKVRAHFAVVITFLFCISLYVTSSSAQNPPQTLVGVTERVSVASDGTQGNRESFTPSISADGRYVAFTSGSSNLVAGDTNGFDDVFVHDRLTGETTRVSVASDGTQGNGDSALGGISAEGRYVAFTSSSTNLVDGDTILCYWRYIKYNCSDVFVHDRVTGETTIVSVASDGTQGNWNSYATSISADGRYVVFGSDASNLVVGDTNFCFTSGITSFGCPDVFVHDRWTGETNRVSVASDGTERSRWSTSGSISADGRYVVFNSFASFVAGDLNDNLDIYIHDQLTGETTWISVASDGNQGNGNSFSNSISADGHYVLFDSESSNLVPGDANNVKDVFVRERETGVTTRVSIASDGIEGNYASWSRSISSDGRYVAFGSIASNLVNGDTNNYCDTDYDNFYDDNCADIFMHDRITGETTLVSVAGNGTQGNDNSSDSSISADGRYVTFDSWASNLVLGDTNNTCDKNFDGTYNENCQDIFVRDREGLVVGYSVTGLVIDSDGNPLPGVNISAGYGYSAMTDSQGDYTIIGLPSGTYRITPSLTDYFFAPSWRTVSVPPERVGINFAEGFPTFLPLIGR